MLEQIEHPLREGGRAGAPSSERAPRDGRKSGSWVGRGIVTILVALGIVWAVKHRSTATEGTAVSGKAGGAAGRGAAMPVPVTAGVVAEKEMPIYLDGLGNVQAFNTVTVHVRVDGQITRIAFKEGQDVKAGDLLAEIDPTPFQAQVDQASAKKAQDEAQLAIARITLKRNGDLLAEKILAQQDYDIQKYLVDQLEGTVKADQAAIDSANVQLGYTKIYAPLAGRTGIRQVDQGNIVHANDSNGLVVITQLTPISVVFTLPEQYLGQIQDRLAANAELSVFAVERDNRVTLGEGKLAVLDNQIDATTGTLRLKATFANQDLRLWPGQFINARLLLTTRKGPIVPAQVVQRGPDGAYVFVIKPNSTVEVRPVTVDRIEQGQALIPSGLVAGEQVVVDGQYKLQAGSLVALGEGGQGGPPTGRPAGRPARAASAP